MYVQEEYLDHFAGLDGSKEKIKKLRLKRSQKPVPAMFRPMLACLEELPVLRAGWVDCASDVVGIGKQDELAGHVAQQVLGAVKTFIPWKKGPYDIFGTRIDAEWRSDLKWQRLQSVLPNLRGQRIADIGCHNGYFMFRTSAHAPELVIGFEPFVRNYLNFLFLQNFAQVPNLYCENFGVEYMHYYPQFFDVVLCLGILYHHHDPVGILRKIHSSMRASAVLIVECQGIEGEEPIALLPANRYLQARGVWFLPTVSCLANWLRRAHFRHVECFFSCPLTSEEQRTTAWAPINSLKEFLDPLNPKRTVEGYPAPVRHYFVAKK